MTGFFVSVNYACEESIVDYLIATVDPLETTASYYTGQGNVEDLDAPAVVISVDQGTETHWRSNLYDLSVNIAIKEMAADTVSGSLGVLAANIYNAVCDPNLKDKINLHNSRSFVTSYVQKQESRHSVRQDALVSELTLRLIGGLSGSV